MILELKTFLWAMTPIGELRLSIPLALNNYHLPVWSAYFISIFGNIIPAVFFLLFLEYFSKYLCRKFPLFKRLLVWVFEGTKKRHHKKFEHWKELALTILVAIPLPFTGAWTGAVCAFVFGIPFRRALPLIFIGVAIAGIIVTLLTLGVINFI